MSRKMKKYSILIPAAGLGSRLKSFTKKKPKPLVKVHGKEILFWQIHYLLKSKIKIKDFHVIVGYKKNQTINFFKKLNLKYRINFYYNKNFRSTGCIYSFFLAAKKIKNDLIYFNSDLIVKDKSLNKLLDNRYKNVILSRKVKQNDFTILQKILHRKNKIFKMDLGPIANCKYEAIGPIRISYKMLSVLLNYKKKINKIYLKKMPCYTYFGLISKETDLYKEDIQDNSWYEINNIKDLKKIKKIFFKI